MHRVLCFIRVGKNASVWKPPHWSSEMNCERPHHLGLSHSPSTCWRGWVEIGEHLSDLHPPPSHTEVVMLSQSGSERAQQRAEKFGKWLHTLEKILPQKNVGELCMHAAHRSWGWPRALKRSARKEGGLGFQTSPGARRSANRRLRKKRQKKSYERVRPSGVDGTFGWWYRPRLATLLALRKISMPSYYYNWRYFELGFRSIQLSHRYGC